MQFHLHYIKIKLSETGIVAILNHFSNIETQLKKLHKFKPYENLARNQGSKKCKKRTSTIIRQTGYKIKHKRKNKTS